MPCIALLCASLLLVPLSSFVPAAGQVVSGGVRAGTWRIDPGRSQVTFTVTKLGFSDVPGQFLKSSGTVRHDTVEPANSFVRWSVRVDSVRTDADNRDRTLVALAQPVPGGFETRFELDRYDFGIVGGRVMSRLIGGRVTIHLVAIAAREDAGTPRPELRLDIP